MDALIALVAAFNHDFHMYWTRDNVAHPQYTRMSTIWEGCLKCYLPAQPLFYLLVLLLGGLTLRCRQCRRLPYG